MYDNVFNSYYGIFGNKYYITFYENVKYILVLSPPIYQIYSSHIWFIEFNYGKEFALIILLNILCLSVLNNNHNEYHLRILFTNPRANSEIDIVKIVLFVNKYY